jgi:hypothetical protein
MPSVDSGAADGGASDPVLVSGAAAAAGSELVLEQPIIIPPRIAAIASVRIVVSLWVPCFLTTGGTLIRYAKARQYLCISPQFLSDYRLAPRPGVASRPG